MLTNPLQKTNVALVVSLILLAFGCSSLRFHNDFFAGLGISAGVLVPAISAWKRHPPDVS